MARIYRPATPLAGLIFGQIYGKNAPDSPLQRLIRRSKHARGPCCNRNLPRLEREQIKCKLKPAAACLCAGLYYLCTVIATMKKTAFILTAFALFHPLRCKEPLLVSRAFRSGAPQPRRRVTDYLTTGLVPLFTYRLLHPCRKNPTSLGLTNKVIPGPGTALASTFPIRMEVPLIAHANRQSSAEEIKPRILIAGFLGEVNLSRILFPRGDDGIRNIVSPALLLAGTVLSATGQGFLDEHSGKLPCLVGRETLINQSEI